MSTSIRPTKHRHAHAPTVRPKIRRGKEKKVLDFSRALHSRAGLVKIESGTHMPVCPSLLLRLYVSSIGLPTRQWGLCCFHGLEPKHERGDMGFVGRVVPRDYSNAWLSSGTRKRTGSPRRRHAEPVCTLSLLQLWATSLCWASGVYCSMANAKLWLRMDDQGALSIHPGLICMQLAHEGACRRDL